MWSDCVWLPMEPAPGNWIKDDVFLIELVGNGSSQEESTDAIMSLLTFLDKVTVIGSTYTQTCDKKCVC